MLGRVDVHRINALQDLASGGVDITDRLHLIAEEFDPHQPVFVGRADLQHIPLHAETAAGGFGVVAAVLVVHQLPSWLRMLRVSPTSNFTAALRTSKFPGRGHN